MKKLISTSEAAKILKISRINVFAKIKKGQIKAFKVGRNYVIPEDEVLKEAGVKIKEEHKAQIRKVVKRGIKEYGDIIKRLGKE